MLKIEIEDWRRLQELRGFQDKHAFALGVLEMEYLRRRASLLDVAEKPDLLALGTLEWEHYQQQTFWYEKIKRTEDVQRSAGEGALRRVGIDPNKGEFSIVDGTVLELREGRWVLVTT